MNLQHWSQSYRRRFLRSNTLWEALDEIYLRLWVWKMNERKYGTRSTCVCGYGKWMKENMGHVWKVKKENEKIVKWKIKVARVHTQKSPCFIRAAVSCAIRTILAGIFSWVLLWTFWGGCYFAIRTVIGFRSLCASCPEILSLNVALLWLWLFWYSIADPGCTLSGLDGVVIPIIATTCIWNSVCVFLFAVNRPICIRDVLLAFFCLCNTRTNSTFFSWSKISFF